VSRRCGHKSEGFGLLEVIITGGMLSLLVLTLTSFSDFMNSGTRTLRKVSARDRVVSGIQRIAGMPAALRNSMRAAAPDGVTPLNPELKACIVGNPPASCRTGVEYPFTLFGPMLWLSNTGAVLGASRVAGPKGAPTPTRFDLFARPCTVQGPDCPIIAYVSFKAQCGPAVAPSPSPTALMPDSLSPLGVCTIAELIEVTYWVAEDTGNGKGYLGVSTGSYTTPVKAISGYDPL
jgi:hypothetical protein